MVDCRRKIIHALGGFTREEVEEIKIKEFREASGFWRSIAKTGEWIFVDVTDDCVIRTDRCSICGETWDSFEKKMPPKYCPNCGVKMEE